MARGIGVSTWEIITDLQLRNGLNCPYRTTDLFLKMKVTSKFDVIGPISFE